MNILFCSLVSALPLGLAAVSKVDAARISPPTGYCKDHDNLARSRQFRLPTEFSNRAQVSQSDL